MKIAGYETHPAADIFPLMSETDLSELAQDISQRGLLEPVLLDEHDLILDGRNRLLACEQVQVDPHFRRYGGEDPVGDVVAFNLKRRHLKASQRMAAAVEAGKLRKALEERAKQRMAEGGSGGTDSTPSKTRDELGKTFGVSGRGVDMAQACREVLEA